MAETPQPECCSPMHFKYAPTREAPCCPRHGVMIAQDEMGFRWTCGSRAAETPDTPDPRPVGYLTTEITRLEAALFEAESARQQAEQEQRRLQVCLNSLYGEQFSDRVYHALKSRVEKAEAERDALKGELAKERHLRELAERGVSELALVNMQGAQELAAERQRACAHFDTAVASEANLVALRAGLEALHDDISNLVTFDWLPVEAHRRGFADAKEKCLARVAALLTSSKETPK